MAVTVEWNETTPAGAETPRQGDDRIRELKEAIRMRMRNGGHLWTAAATDVEDGRHVCGTENVSGGPGTPLTGEFYIYAADQTTRIVTVGDSTAATPSRMALSTLDVLPRNYLYRVPTSGGSVTLDETHQIYLVTSTATVTVTLPLAASHPGRLYLIRSVATPSGANTHTVARSGADLILTTLSPGAATYALATAGGATEAGSLLVVSDGTATWVALTYTLPT